MLRILNQIFTFNIFRFALIGLIFAILDIFLLVFFVENIGLPWFYVAPVIFFFLTIIHYFVVIAFVFNSNPQNRGQEIFKSLSIGIIGIITNQLILFLGISFLSMSVLLSKFISIFFNFLLNYFLRKLFVFKN